MKVENNKFPYVTTTPGAAPATPDSGDVRLFVDVADGLAKLIDDGDVVTTIGSGIADGGSFTSLVGLDGAAPADPTGDDATLYVKLGRVYSRDSAGVEYGPFDAAGVGGAGLYSVDETFPGSSLPAGWTSTGGTVTVSGGKAHMVGSAITDRIMYAWVPTRDNFVVRAHLKSISNPVGMPSLVALDASGKGVGCGPYNDGSVYAWTCNGTAYQYSGTNVQVSATQDLTDVWLQLMVVDGHIVGAGWSTDEVTWKGMNANAVAQFTITQVGICNVLGSSTWDLYELTITEP